MSGQQVSRNQHFVPKFYLKRFADGDHIRVLDVRAKRLRKTRPYTSVCYEEYFYGMKTGVLDEVSQLFEKWLGALETLLADRLPLAIEHAHAQKLTGTDLDMLAHMMSLQWLRTGFFRNRLRQVASDLMKQIAQLQARHPDFAANVQQMAHEHGTEINEQQAEELKAFLLKGHYTVHAENWHHLRFLAPDNVFGFHNLFYRKQWNILKATAQYRFVTSDNPVAEWLSRRAGIYERTFVDNKHYFPLTPELLIESVRPNRDALDAPPSQTVVYKTCTDDEVLMYDMVVANHSQRYAYAKSSQEFGELLHQLKKPGAAIKAFRREYL